MKKITILFSALVLTAFGWQANAQSFNGGACPDGLAIPDSDPTGVNDTIAVTGAGTALGTDIVLDQVNLHITHTWGDDIDVTLTSPNGVTIDLTSDNGGSGRQYGDDCNNMTNFSINAGASITTGTANFVGSFMPEQTFNDFNDGSSANGDWVINVSDDTGGDTGNLEFIELIFAAPATCPAPSTLAVTNITATTADLGWTETASAMSWQVEWGMAGFTQGMGTFVIVNTTPTEALTGLTAATGYDFYVRAICTPGDTSSWVGKQNFTTAIQGPVGVTCITNSPMFVYTMEFGMQGGWTGDISATETDGDWVFPQTGGTTSGSTGPDAAHSGNDYAYYESSGGTTDTASMISPAIDLTMATDEAELSFWMHAYGADMSTLSVGVSNSATGPFTNVFSYTGELQTANADAWQQVGVNLDTYVGQTIYVEYSYYGLGGFNADMAIDLMQVETCAPAPTCNFNLGVDTNICSTDNITLDAGMGDYTYSWMVDGTPTGDTTQMIVLDTAVLGGNGTYTVIATVTDTLTSCTSNDTIVLNYSTCTGINVTGENVTLNVSPNPNKGVFTLNVNTTDVNELAIKVTNIQGQTVFNKTNFNNLANVNEKVDLSNNAKGIYFVTVTSDKGVKTHKIVVQ